MASTRWITGKPKGITGTAASCHRVPAPAAVHRNDFRLATPQAGTGVSGEIGAVRSKDLSGGGSG